MFKKKSLENLFNFKKKIKLIQIGECSFMKIGDSAVSKYIKYLEGEYEIKYISYRVENINGELRCFFRTYTSNRKAISYFNDRCPAMIENEIKNFQYNSMNNLLKPNIIMIPIEGTLMYNCAIPDAVKIGDGKSPYNLLPYVYRFRLSVPEDTDLTLNACAINKLFVDLLTDIFGNINKLEEKFLITDVKDTIYPRCVEFYLKVDPKSAYNNFFRNSKEFDLSKPSSQLNNKLNNKLRKYLGFSD